LIGGLKKSGVRAGELHGGGERAISQGGRRRHKKSKVATLDRYLKGARDRRKGEQNLKFKVPAPCWANEEKRLHPLHEEGNCGFAETRERSEREQEVRE